MARLGKAAKGSSRRRAGTRAAKTAKVTRQDKELLEKMKAMQEADYLRRLAEKTKSMLKVSKLPGFSPRWSLTAFASIPSAGEARKRD